jgi:integrase
MSLYRHPKSPNWWCRFQLDGREFRLSTGTADRRQAEEFETLARNRAYKEIRLGHRAPYPWKDAGKRWLSETRKRSKDFDERIIAWLDEQLGDATLDDITRDVVDELRKLKAEETGESTADRYMALLRAILKKAVDEWGKLDAMPKVPMYRPEVPEPRWLTAAEFARLIKELPPHLKAAASFAVLTGLRMRAMLSLTWDQVDLKAGRAWVASESMKGKRSHGIPLSKDAVAVLSKIERVEGCPWIFNWRGKRVSDCNGHAFKDAVTAAKVAPLRWHDLRHTWASWAVQSGVSLHELMLLGGWRSLVMVQRYAHLAPDHLSAAAGKVRITGPAAKNRHTGKAKGRPKAA